MTVRAVLAAIHASRFSGIVGVGRARANHVSTTALQIEHGGDGDGHDLRTTCGLGRKTVPGLSSSSSSSQSFDCVRKMKSEGRGRVVL
jgi:hypothetical protein